MPIFQNSYQTTMGSLVATEKIERSIKESLIQSELSSDTLGITPIGDYHPIFVSGLHSNASDIGLFTHPITVTDRSGKKYVVSDLRMVSGIDQLKTKDILHLDHDIADMVRNQTDYRFIKARAILDAVWQSGGTTRIKNDLSFAGQVFSTWLPDLISKSFSLEFGDLHRLTILTHAYYQSLFIEGGVLSNDDKDRIAIHTIKAASSNSTTVYEVLDKIEGFEDIRDFCKYVPVVTQSLRLKDFNIVALLDTIAYSWYGLNAKDMLAVALEHPPTWCAIIHSALSERTYRNSLIARVSERLGKRGNADSFIKSFTALMRENTVVAMESEVKVDPAMFGDFE